MDLILPYIGKYLLHSGKKKKIFPDVNALRASETRRAGVANNYTLCSDDSFNTGSGVRGKRKPCGSEQAGWLEINMLSG